MIIQWYPGHMTKAIRDMEANLKKVDAVIYVLDARAPMACINPKFDSLFAGKPRLYVLNKCDTVEQADLRTWTEYFEGKGYPCIKTNSAVGRDVGGIASKVKELCSAKIESYKAKGANVNVRAMVIGIPNSGKSTLINSLCGGKKTVTGDKPGVTKAQQWVFLANNVDLLDTPGTLWPSFDDQNLARDLVYIGSIKDDVVDVNELALTFIEKLSKTHPELLKQRYKLTELEDTPLAVYEQIARSRGYLLRGGDVDYDRTAAALLDDFRKQRIGKICLEKPPKK